VKALDLAANATNSNTLSFTVSCGGGGIVSPAKPAITGIAVTDWGGKLDIRNLPAAISQVAASATSDFKGASWQAVSALQGLLDKLADKAKFYLKFRSNNGGVSDVLTYEKKTSGFVTISEGDIVKTAANPDVHIIRYRNGKQYKRLILSPSVFRSYQHLKWENIKVIPQEQMDGFMTSNLVQVANDMKVYELMPEGDTGRRRVFAVYKDGILRLAQNDGAKAYDADSVYEINTTDRDSYRLLK
jgi:hypothetical protein